MVDQDTEDTTRQKKPLVQYVFDMNLGRVLDQRNGVWPFLAHSVRQIQVSALAML